MTEAPNTNTIETYLEGLEECQKKAQRNLDVNNAAVKKANADYTRALSNLNKFKAYWDKIEMTNTKGDLAISAYEATKDSIKNLKEKLSAEVEALEFLTQQAILCSNTMEQYSNCLEELTQKIDRLSNSKIDKSNAVIKALKDLYAAYEEALVCAQTVFTQLLMVLEKSYILQFKLEGTSNPLTECDGYNITIPDANDSSTHDLIHDGLEKCMEDSLEHLCEAFPLFKVTTDGNCALDYDFPHDDEDPNPDDCPCDSYNRFVRRTYDKLNDAIAAANDTSNALSAAVQAKNQAQATKEAIDKSLETANAAKAC